MAMLAEKRRKTKFVLTPVAKPLWTQETSQFGKKIMEKMGWAAGKGLGASEQGIHEPLRANYKQDSKGMGYSGQGNPFENLDQFNALLASLSGEVSNEDVVHSFESLEEKSKLSRSRVHYKKFTRGKDVSRYSNVDLSCIVGTGKKVEEEIVEEEFDHTGEEEHSHGVTTINSGSIADYFTLKMRKRTDIPDSEPAIDDEGTLNNETDEQVTLNNPYHFIEEDSKTEKTPKKSKKSRKNRDDLKTLENIKNVDVNTTNKGEEEFLKDIYKCETNSEQLNIDDSEPLHVKSKKKKKHKEKLSEDIEENTVDNLENNELEITKKDKKRKKRSKEISEDVNNFDSSSVKYNPSDNSEIKKKHKRRKEASYDLINREETNEICDVDISVLEVDNIPSKKKKKKHRKEKKHEIGSDCFELISKNIEDKIENEKKKVESDDSNEILANLELKAEKKKKKKQKLTEEIHNQEEIEVSTLEDGSETKKRKFLQEDDEKYEDLEIQPKIKKKDCDRENVPILSQGEQNIQSDEISKQFKGSNLGSLPGYGNRRANRTGH